MFYVSTSHNFFILDSRATAKCNLFGNFVISSGPGTETLSSYNRLDRFTALTLFTIGGYRLIHENMKGRLLKDFAADLVILNKDYFTIVESEIPGITSLLTIVDGKIVYGDRAVYPVAPVRINGIPDWSPVNFY